MAPPSSVRGTRPRTLWWLGAIFAPYIVALLPYTWRVVRTGGRRVALLAWTAIVLLGVLVQPDSEPATIRTVSGAAATSTVATKPRLTPSPTSKIVQGVPGRPARFDGLEFTVTDVQKKKTLTRGPAPASRYQARRPRLPGGGHLPNVGCPGNCIPNPNLPNHLPSGAIQSADGNTLTTAGTYLIVYMTVANLDDHSQFSNLGTTLVDTTGHAHEPDIYASTILTSENSFGYLSARQVKKLAIVFDIPAQAGPRRLGPVP